MILSGYIKDKEGTKFTVEIDGGGIERSIIDGTTTYDRSKDHLYFFGKDPVHISCERSDLSQLILISQCQINILTKTDVSKDLCADTNRSIKVTITKSEAPDNTNGIIWRGYVDPLCFNQGFSYQFEELTINATDPLGALELYKIDQIGIKSTESMTVFALIYKILNKVMPGASIDTYFGSVVDPNAIKVNCSVFFGDDPDDYQTLYDVLTTLLKYIGCTVSYEPKSGNFVLYCIYNNTGNTSSHQWFDGKEDAMDANTSISNDDVYSKITLTCNIEPSDDDIDLLDRDFLRSDWDYYQKYMTELVCPGEGSSAYNGFCELMNSKDNYENTGYDAGYALEHFCYVKRSDLWDFGNNSYIEAMGGTEGTNPTPMTGDQTGVLRWLKKNPMKAAFVSFGKGQKANKKDNAVVTNISLSDYLVISIDGHNDHRVNGHNNTMNGQMLNNCPICKYNGLRSLNLTPTDKTVTNYICISGKITLNPQMKKTGPNWGRDTGFDDNWHHGNEWSNLYNASTNTYSATKSGLTSWSFPILGYMGRTVPNSDNGDGTYYQQKWWTCSNPFTDKYVITDEPGITGGLDNKEYKMLNYKYTSYSGHSGNEEDIVSKLPILNCQLKVGDKWCVERLDKGIEGQGKFEWMTQAEWEASPMPSKGFDRPYFTLGINIKTGDSIVGVQYDIQKNISYLKNVDCSGTGIPITMDDKLNGEVYFAILSPCNQMWNEIERIHPTLFRHTEYVDHKLWTLEFVESILIGDLKIEFKSDNGLQSKDKNEPDKDLVYASSTNHKYQDSFDDDIDICTPLTLEQCKAKGVKYQISNSYVMNADDSAFYGWTVGQTTVKPEELWVDYLYKQYSQPATKLEINVNAGYAYGAPTTDGSYLNISTILSKYLVTMNYPGISGTGNYYAMKIDWGIKYGDNQMTCREVLSYSDPFS